MSSIASLGRMVSGLVASQKGLQVTGHNLANLNTKGYTRQQLLQHDSSYLNIGSVGTLKQVGLGVSVTEIRQVRDEFADRRYRTENSVLSFYQTKYDATLEVEAILDEPHGESLSGIMNDFWRQTQKLATNPAGVEERLAFIQTADVLAKRMNQIMDGYTEYQYHLNEQVKDGINQVNALLDGIQSLNEKIVMGEINGDNANDYRDQRNVLLDELSRYIDIDYYENPDGRVTVSTNGMTILDDKFVVEMDYKYVDGNNTGFVVPIWANTNEEVFSMDHPISGSKGNDTGKLQSLLMTRGNVVANADTKWREITLDTSQSIDVEGNAYMIPRLQKELAMLSEEIARVVNETLGKGHGLQNEAGVDVFVTIDPNKPLSAGNIKVNEKLLEEGGYNKLGTALDPANVGDNTLVSELLTKWGEARKWPPDPKPGEAVDPVEVKCKPSDKHANFMDFYAEYVSDIGAEGYKHQGKVREKLSVVQSTDNERQGMGGVSQDEELSNMLKYQYAYNASARMINVMDGMMDTIINRL